MLQTNSEAISTNPMLIASHVLEKRQSEDFTMVEIGHGISPAAYQQPNFFIGKRKYYGVEKWLRKPEVDLYMLQLQNEATGNKNVTFINQLSTCTETGSDIWSMGEEQDNYQNLMPDVIADEILLANVLGDPQVCTSLEIMTKILENCTSILNKDAPIIVLETISPVNIDYLTQALSSAGLSMAAVVFLNSSSINIGPFKNSDIWALVSKNYKSILNKHLPNPSSYCLFATK